MSAPRPFWVTLLRRLLLPIVLALPAVAILLWQAQVQRTERVALKAAAQALAAQTAELRDFGRLHSLSLARKQIVETVQASMPGTAALLSAVGSLPADLRLLRLEMSDSTAMITVEGDEAAVLGAVAALAAHGMSSIRLLSHQPQHDGKRAARLLMQLRAEAAP